MKAFEAEVGGRRLAVRVERDGPHLRITVGTCAYVVDARSVGDAAWSLLVASEGDGGPTRSIDAALVEGPEPGAFDVHLCGSVVPVRLRPFRAWGRRAAAAAARPDGPQRVVAPMPGKIVRVLVASGDEVAPRQGLVVVEAMKMENELRAARAGRVREVAVTEGQSVEAGALLLVVG